ncbi:MAG: hypothetical protein WC728_12610 [Elusimicrobiota bacterium]
MKRVVAGSLGIALLAGIFLTGCQTRLTDFTVLSTKNVDISKLGTYKRGGKRVEGADLQTIILFFPTSGPPNMKEAIDRAIESVPGCMALVDGVLYNKMVYFVLGGQGGYVVEGTCLIDPSLARGHRQSDYVLSRYNPKTRNMENQYLDETSFREIHNSVVSGDKI